MNETFVLCLSVLLLTSFVRVLTSLSILRYGLGLYASSFGIVILSLSIAISFYISSPYIERIGGISNIKSYEAVQEEFRPFLEKKVDKELYKSFYNKLTVNNNLKNSDELDKNQGEVVQDKLTKKQQLDLLTFVFVISELKDALKYGVMILIPFLVIDLIVMNIFMVLNLKDFSYQVVSLPIKLGVFVACDGLKIITEKLIYYYI